MCNQGIYHHNSYRNHHRLSEYNVEGFELFNTYRINRRGDMWHHSLASVEDPKRIMR